jgi:hypothetical protein
MNPIYKIKIENGKIYWPEVYLPDGEYELIIRKPKKGRSSNQNRYYFGVVLRLLSDHTGYSVDDLHETMKSMFNPLRLEFNTKKGTEAIRASKSTTELTTVKMEEYLSQIREWASQSLGVFIPLPNEVDY